MGQGDLARSFRRRRRRTQRVISDEMVVDNTVNLFQIADVSRLLVVANCPEDVCPTWRP